MYNGIKHLRPWCKSWLEDIALLFVFTHKRFVLWQQGISSGAEWNKAVLNLHVSKLNDRWEKELQRPNLHNEQKKNPIQICEMKCGCWIVGDGNNRVGLMLRKTPEATIADIPKSLLATARFGKWDSETMDWWNPCPKSFRNVMSKRGKQTPEPRNSIYGVIEIDKEGKFLAYTPNVKKGTATSAIGHTADEAKRLLEEKIKIMLNRDSISLVLTPMTPLEHHQCSSYQ